MPERDSGLIGEWVGQPAWSRGDTIVWRFDAAGTADRSRVRWRARHDGSQLSVNRESLGRWRTFLDSTHAPRRLVCFDYGRQRARLPCWYFTIEGTDRPDGRVLKLFGRVGAPSRAPEIYRLAGRPQQGNVSLLHASNIPRQAFP